MEKKARRSLYPIPKNFMESGYLFNGRFKTRNFTEGVIAEIPCFLLFNQVRMRLELDNYTAITMGILILGGIFFLFITGVNGDSVLEFLSRVSRFRKNKSYAKYNPRVKLEHQPDYLLKNQSNRVRERILETLEQVGKKLLGDDGAEINPEILDATIRLYYEDDEGVLEKPGVLKTSAEKRAEKKARKRERKNQRRAERAYLMSLPREERWEKRKELREAALLKNEKEKLEEEYRKLESEEKICAATRSAEAVKARLYRAEQERLEEDIPDYEIVQISEVPDSEESPPAEPLNESLVERTVRKTAEILPNRKPADSGLPVLVEEAVEAERRFVFGYDRGVPRFEKGSIKRP